MKIWTSTSRSFLVVLIAAASLLPASAFAAIKITDVMYDPPGADGGHEWIKIENTGSDAVNIAGYKLAEGGSNHKLTAVQGTLILDANAVAIITTDLSQYESDHPSFTGAIFKSSFSLSNTGETIELKDAKLNVVDTYSYTAPPIVKAAASPKISKSSSKSKSKTTFAFGTDISAASLALAPTAPAVPKQWLYGLGALAVLIAGAAGVLYVYPNKRVTLSSGDEFEITE